MTEQVEQWGIYEVALPGPSGGNPFSDVTFSARFMLELPGKPYHAVQARLVED